MRVPSPVSLHRRRQLLAGWPLRLLLSVWFCLFVPHRARAAGENVIPNGGFEDPTTVEDNLWDGVDSGGFLSGFRFSAHGLSENKNYEGIPMPPSVAFVDLNGDGKPDLITADPTGYFRFYPNNGTPTAPHFTTGEILPFYVSTTFRPREHVWSDFAAQDYWRFCPRFALADWRHTGVLDFLIGNYYGELLFIPNSGTAKQPVFRQPSKGPEGARISTSEKNHFWANLLSPAAADWNGNGHVDLVTGEGTYSADAIHLLENTGAGDLPKFTDARHTRIAFGDGREHLMPAVVDYDGDGNPDLLVADRSGEIGVYLNPGKGNVNPEFKRVSKLSFGGKTKLSGLVAPYAADFNGDGLFDLIVGLPNGHIAVALNTGTKGQPSFGPLQDIKGEDRLGKNVKLPKNWTTNTSSVYGNALAYFTVVDAADDPAAKPPEGSHCLKAGYWPVSGETFPFPPEGIPGAVKHFTLSSGRLNLDQNKTYQLSFKVKNSGMRDLHYSFTSRFTGVPSTVKIERGERGELKNHDAFTDESIHEGHNFEAGSDWTFVTGIITPRYKSANLKDQPQASGSLDIEFWANNLSNVIYFDDISLIEQGK